MMYYHDLNIIFKTPKVNKETSRNYSKAINKYFGGLKQFLRIFCSSTVEYMVLYVIYSIYYIYYYFSIVYSHRAYCRALFFPTDTYFSASSARGAGSKNYFPWRCC